jgi:hypothetical protein
MSSNDATATVMIGGREVSLLMAALLAQEADRLGVLPGQVRQLAVPDPAPTHVLISGFRLSIGTGAAIAAASDAQAMLPVKVIESILREYAESLGRKARTRKTARALEGTWAVPSDSPKRKGGDGGGNDET